MAINSEKRLRMDEEFYQYAVFFNVTPRIGIDIVWPTGKNIPMIYDAEIGTFNCDHPVGSRDMRR